MDGAVPPQAPAPLSLRHGAFDSEVPVGRWRFWVRRDLDLWRRIEQRFGALDPLLMRLRATDVTLDEIVELHQIALARQEQKMPQEAIGQHVVRVGLAQAVLPMTMLVMALGMGNDKCAEAFADPFPDDEEGLAPKAEKDPRAA